MTATILGVDTAMLETLKASAQAATHAPVCKPFRADILETMCAEIQAWRALYPHYEFDPVTEQIVHTGINK